MRKNRVHSLVKHKKRRDGEGGIEREREREQNTQKSYSKDDCLYIPHA